MSCIFPIDKISHHYRRQLRTRHVVAQVESGVRTLIISLRSTLHAICRVFLQAIDIVNVGCVVCCKTYNTHAHSVLLMEQHQFLTPVTDDVTPEGSTLGIDGNIPPSTQFCNLNESAVIEVLDIHIIMAITCFHNLAIQLIVPPYTFRWIRSCVLRNQVTLGIVDTTHR